MRALIEKLLSSTYEALGIVVPGTAFVGLLVGLLTSTFALLGEWERVAPIAGWFMAGGETLAGTLSIGLLGYLFGQILKWTAKGPTRRAPSEERDPATRPYRAWRNLLLLRGGSPSKDLSTSAAELLAQLEPKLRIGRSPDGTSLSWSAKMRVLRAHHHQTIGRGLFDDFQDKYTFHRSIAAAAALLVWLNVICAVAAVVYSLAGDDIPLWRAMLTLLPQALFIPTLLAFARSYEYYWGLFADSLISEVWTTVARLGVEPATTEDPACSK